MCRWGVWTDLSEDSWSLLCDVWLLLKRLKCQEWLSYWGPKCCLLPCLAQGLEEFEDKNFLQDLSPWGNLAEWWPESSWSSYSLAQGEKCKCSGKWGWGCPALADLALEITQSLLLNSFGHKQVTSLLRFKGKGA